MSRFDETHFITISFSLLIFLSGLFLKSNTLRDTSDVYLIYMLLLSSILIISSQNSNLVDCAHLLFMAYIYLVSIFSNNKYLLFMNVCILLVILLSRRYYNYCVINNKVSSIGPFEKFNKYINTKGTIEQGNILFCGTILFLFLKITVNISGT